MNSREKAHAATSANEGGLTSKTIDHPHLSEQMGTNECKTAADWSFTDMSVPSVTLKIAVDRNWAVDDLSDGPKRFTSQASLDAGATSGRRQLSCSCLSAPLQFQLLHVVRKHVN